MSQTDLALVGLFWLQLDTHKHDFQPYLLHNIKGTQHKWLVYSSSTSFFLRLNMQFPFLKSTEMHASTLVLYAKVNISCDSGEHFKRAWISSNMFQIQNIYWDSKLLAHVACFAKLFETVLWITLGRATCTIVL